MCSLINKQLLLTAYAYLFIMEQEKAQQGSEALRVENQSSTQKKRRLPPQEEFAYCDAFRAYVKKRVEQDNHLIPLSLHLASQKYDRQIPDPGAHENTLAGLHRDFWAARGLEAQPTAAQAKREKKEGRGDEVIIAAMRDVLTPTEPQHTLSGGSNFGTVTSNNYATWTEFDGFSPLQWKELAEDNKTMYAVHAEDRETMGKLAAELKGEISRPLTWDHTVDAVLGYLNDQLPAEKQNETFRIHGNLQDKKYDGIIARRGADHRKLKEYLCSSQNWDQLLERLAEQFDSKIRYMNSDYSGCCADSGLRFADHKERLNGWFNEN